MHVRLRNERAHIKKLIDEGHPFEAVEDYIDRLDTSGEARAALWLWAWSHENPITQRRVADEALAAVDRDSGRVSVRAFRRAPPSVARNRPRRA